MLPDNSVSYCEDAEMSVRGSGSGNRRGTYPEVMVCVCFVYVERLRRDVLKSAILAIT